MWKAPWLSFDRKETVALEPHTFAVRSTERLINTLFARPSASAESLPLPFDAQTLSPHEWGLVDAAYRAGLEVARAHRDRETARRTLSRERRGGLATCAGPRMRLLHSLVTNWGNPLRCEPEVEDFRRCIQRELSAAAAQGGAQT